MLTTGHGMESEARPKTLAAIPPRNPDGIAACDAQSNIDARLMATMSGRLRNVVGINLRIGSSQIRELHEIVSADVATVIIIDRCVDREIDEGKIRVLHQAVVVAIAGLRYTRPHKVRPARTPEKH